MCSPSTVCYLSRSLTLIFKGICLSVCLYVHLSVCLYVHLCVCLSICPSMCLSVYMSIYLSVCLCVCLSVYMSIYLSVCLYVYMSIYLSVFQTCGQRTKKTKMFYQSPLSYKIFTNHILLFLFFTRCVCELSSHCSPSRLYDIQRVSGRTVED